MKCINCSKEITSSQRFFCSPKCWEELKKHESMPVKRTIWEITENPTKSIKHKCPDCQEVQKEEIFACPTCERSHWHKVLRNKREAEDKVRNNPNVIDFSHDWVGERVKWLQTSGWYDSSQPKPKRNFHTRSTQTDLTIQQIQKLEEFEDQVEISSK